MSNNNKKKKKKKKSQPRPDDAPAAAAREAKLAADMKIFQEAQAYASQNPGNTGLTSTCRKCNKPAKRTCSGCGIYRYCTSICQKADWHTQEGGHKKDCQRIQAERKAMARLGGEDSWVTKNKAVVAVAVTHDLHEFCTPEEIAASGGISHMTTLLLLQNKKTLGFFLTVASKNLNVGVLLELVKALLRQFASFPKTGSGTVMDRFLRPLKEGQSSSWMLPTGSPQGVKSYVKLAKKILQKSNGMPVMGKINAVIQHMR